MIIFDCDGVVLDSEVLGTEIDIQYLQKYGVIFSQEIYSREYCGLSYESVLAKIFHETGINIPEKFIIDTQQALLSAFENQLSEIAGIRAFLEKITRKQIKFCIASSSSMQRLQHSLSCVDLYSCFEGRIYSAQMVGRGKPAPDLFLHAALQQNISPEKCRVIEDSPYGIQAAKSAGMQAIGFTAGAHCVAGHEALLKEAGADYVCGSYLEIEKYFKL